MSSLVADGGEYEAIKEKKQNIDQYKSATSGGGAPSSPAPKQSTAKVDKVGKGPYGSGKGEKRIDVSGYLKPLKKGATRVKKTGRRLVHKGETVLTLKQAKKLRKIGRLKGKKVVKGSRKKSYKK